MKVIDFRIFIFALIISNMKISSTVILLVMITISCNVDSNELANMSNITDQFYEDGLRLNPLNATFNGDNRFNDQLPIDISDEHIKNLKSYYSSYKDQLNQIEKSDLPAQEQLNFDILKWEIEINEEALDFPNHLMPINQFWGLHLMMGQLASGSSAQPFETEADYQNWLKRLDQYKVWCALAIERMKEGIEKNYVLPIVLVEKTIPQFEALLEEDISKHLYYGPINNLPDSFSKEVKEDLTVSYKEVIVNDLIPVFQKMHDFLKNEYLSSARETHGLSALPQGEQIYQHLIKYWTTTNMTAEEIHNIGLQEVQRIRSEMEQVKDQVGFTGDLNSFFEFIRNNNDLKPFKSAQEVVANFNNIHKRMLPHLEKLFDKKPKTPFEVRRTEAFREASASAEYNPGTPDGSRPGVFYVPVPDATAYNTFTDESLFLHEAIPGHHYQISLTQESNEIPDFRKFLWYGAYGEGWALYCESLGKELGLYDDPYQYFGMLNQEIHRAIRLVVDTGIHDKSWSREKAIAYCLSNEAEPVESIIAEVERYMALPGQALSYKIGQLKIQKLRSKASQQLGDRFLISEFHNELLDSGCLPLELLEDKIENWISAKT